MMKLWITSVKKCRLKTELRIKQKAFYESKEDVWKEISRDMRVKN